MKIKYFFLFVILFSQLSFSQTMTLHKTDQTTLDFQLAQVDSITFSVGPESTSLDIIKGDSVSEVKLTSGIDGSNIESSSLESSIINSSKANPVENNDLSKAYNYKKEEAVIDIAIAEKTNSHKSR